MEKNNPKYISKAEALQKLQRYCAYQDRCHQEVRSKLLNLGIYGNDLEEVIVALISENFLNEERFARAYCRGKFRIKGWGKNRIRQELQRRAISDYCIRKAMEEIEEAEYLNTLQEILARKRRLVKESDDFRKRQKLADYAIRKGYEPTLVWEMIKDITDH